MIIGLRLPTQNSRDFPLFHISSSLKIVPSPGVPLQKIHFVQILISSEGKLLPRFDIIFIIICPNELFKCSVCFLCLFNVCPVLFSFVICGRRLCCFCYWSSGY
jgi:hypothetical protein